MSTRKVLIAVLVASFAMLALGVGTARSVPPEPDTASLAALAAAPATDGPHLGGEITVSAYDNEQYMPAVAYNWKHGEYLVVWHNTWTIGSRDIRARRVSESGQLLDEFTIYENPTRDSAQPSVAYDSVNDRYLVVWIYDNFGNGSDWDLYGRFIPWNGPEPGLTEFPIITWSTSQWNPRLAYARAQEEFLVVWTNTYTAGTPPAYVSGRRIRADGSGFPSTGSDLTLNHASLNYINPDVTYNLARNEYLVVWEEVDSSRDIWAVRLRGDAFQMSGGPFGIAEWPDDEEHPAVAACNEVDKYLVTWQSDVGTGGTNKAIYGRFVNGDGSLDGGPILIDNTTSPETESDVDCNMSGRQYLVAYQQRYTNLKYGITGRLVYPDHSQEPAFVIIPPGQATDRTNPVVAGGYSTYLVAWEHQRDGTSYQDIHGRLISPYALFLPMVLRSYP